GRFGTDPKGGGKTLRAPNGVVLDGREFWSAGKPMYDPAKITAPVLLVLGEWDRETPPYMAQTLFPLLTNAAWKRFAMLSEGTHSIALEKNRMLLLRTVQQFLEEPAPVPAATEWRAGMLGSLGGQRPSLAGYVAGRGTRRGETAAGGC